MSTNTWHAWFDGATKHANPGIRGIGALLKGPAGQYIEIAQEIGHGTNNEAEYCALMAVLDAAVEAQVQELKVQIPKVHLIWIPREENGEADALSKRAIGIVTPVPLDRTVWMKITEIGKPFGLSGVALGKRMDAAKLREGGKPTQLALDNGCALRVENNFGHEDFWHRKLLPAALRDAMLLD